MQEMEVICKSVGGGKEQSQHKLVHWPPLPATAKAVR